VHGGALGGWRLRLEFVSSCRTTRPCSFTPAFSRRIFADPAGLARRGASADRPIPAGRGRPPVHARLRSSTLSDHLVTRGGRLDRGGGGAPNAEGGCA